jgi:thiamine pyrophosphate-dependent acetolactate synthase large subunit-like protein
MPPILQIDVEKDQIGKQYPVELGIVGDASETLSSLISALSVDDSKLAERRERAERLKKQFADEVIKLASPQVSIIDKISGVLPDDAIVVQGMTVTLCLMGALRGNRGDLRASWHGSLVHEDDDEVRVI